MITRKFNKLFGFCSNRRVHAAVLLSAAALIGMMFAQGCEKKPEAKEEVFAFPSAADAVDDFVTALRTDDIDELKAVLGKEGEDIVSSGDDVADHNARVKFLELYDEKHTIVDEGPEKASLVVGNKDWPLPIPLVHCAEGWYFDSAAGREEILNRRIGDNELSTIKVCQAVGDAERDYALMAKDVKGMRFYAQKFFSDPGKYNGLYWPEEEGKPKSPLGPLAAEAAGQGYKRDASKPSPYHGYYYRILTSQGPDAQDGELDYIVKDRMVLGYAVLAYPADYGNSGIMTFMMAADGVVYQKDLGLETMKQAEAIKAYNPGAGWKKAE